MVRPVQSEARHRPLPTLRHGAHRLGHRAVAEALGEAPVWGLGAAAGAAVAMINALGPDGIAPFIYFRF